MTGWLHRLPIFSCGHNHAWIGVRTVSLGGYYVVLRGCEQAFGFDTDTIESVGNKTPTSSLPGLNI